MTVLLPVKDLFGGAIRMGVPPQWTDLSDLRQVPDNQEVGRLHMPGHPEPVAVLPLAPNVYSWLCTGYIHGSLTLDASRRLLTPSRTSPLYWRWW
jgi:hypothetical protein